MIVHPSKNQVFRRTCYFMASLILVSVAIGRIVYVKWGNLYLLDLSCYCAISKALWQGLNPFPDHMEVLMFSYGEHVPIVYPGQMLLFALPGFLWSDAFQIGYLILNIIGVILLTGVTLTRACGFQWRDLTSPGRRQFVFAVCCFVFFSSWNVMTTMRIGQISVLLAACFYGIFWLKWPAGGRSVLFSLVAVCKYSLLPVVAPLLFFKGHRKLCLVAFFIFLLFSLSPMLRGNSLRDIYVGYSQAVKVICSPGGVNHYDTQSVLLHLAFFKKRLLNHILKSLCIGLILFLFWRERKSSCISDTLMLLGFSLTLLVCYHGIQDFSIVFPLFFIRLWYFAREKAWWRFGVTLFFPLYLCVPGRMLDMLASRIGAIPQLGTIVYLCDSWNHQYHHLFPIHAIFAIGLALWSSFLYVTVKETYRFEISPENTAGKV